MSTTNASPRPSLSDQLTRLARLDLPPWTWLALCGLLMIGIFDLAFAQRYTLAAAGNLPLQTIATLSKLSADGAFIYIAACAALFGLYLLGYHLGARRLVQAGPHVPRNTWLILAGGALIMNVVLLPMYPVDAADVYDYIIRGRMSSIYGLNPLHDVPNQVQSDPFYRFAAWHDVSSAYGPAWEALASLASRIAGDDSTTNVIVFKLLSLLAYAAAALLIGLTLRELAPRRMIAGVYLFAWNPLIILMTSGGGHNDTLIAACMVLSLYCLARRWYAAATLGALLGALVKFIPLLLIPMIALIALRELRGIRLARYVLISALLGGALAVAFYGPFWAGIETIRPERRAAMYTGSFATLIRQQLAPVLDHKDGSTWTTDTPVTNGLLSDVTLALFVLFYFSQLETVWRDRDRLRPTRAVLLVLMFYLLVSCLWFQSWYVIWVLPLAALLDDTFLRRLVLAVSYLVTWQSLLYNFVTLRPGGFAPLPWRDLVPVGVVMGLSWAYVGWYWLQGWLRKARRTALPVSVGARLRVARETAQLSPADLAEHLGWSTDALLAYEQGDCPIPLDRMETLCERLGLALPTLAALDLPSP